jgi:hypothetical protein
MKRKVIVTTPDNQAKILRFVTEVSTVYDHMDKTFLVMLDRSMWFHPSYESLIANKMSALITYEPKLKGQEESFREPLTFAFGYAQKVFLCTAIEICLLHHYTNSAYFYFNYSKGDFDSLPTLKRWVESRRDSQGWDKWKELNAEQRLKMMKEMSFSSLSIANDFFGDIYGKSPFQQALTDNGYKVFLKHFQNIQEQRNGIVHRGGEFKDGSRIEVTKSDIKETYETAKSFRNHLLRFSAWCRDWWIGNIS